MMSCWQAHMTMRLDFPARLSNAKPGGRCSGPSQATNWVQPALISPSMASGTNGPNLARLNKVKAEPRRSTVTLVNLGNDIHFGRHFHRNVRCSGAPGPMDGRCLHRPHLLGVALYGFRR